ncbi:hypothetical protein [Methylophaga lonarensis]|uniref:hypothetical protein n=1 Tax=Methylophaga lonarensis TaxID=999151 RepID=UPI003D2C9222
MKFITFASTLFALALGTAAYADVIYPHTVNPGSIKTFEYQGQQATVSSDVPAVVYGEYRLDMTGSSGKVSRTITLNADGTGNSHNYGNNEEPQHFEWGVLVNDGVTEITAPNHLYTYWVMDPLNKETYSDKAYVVVMKYHSGEFGSLMVFEQEGVMIIPGPSGMGIAKY